MPIKITVMNEIMKIKAQFRVTKVAALEGGHEEVTAIAHYGNGPENNDYSKWTPSGELKIIVTDQTQVHGNVKPGDFMVMDISLKRA